MLVFFPQTVSGGQPAKPLATVLILSAVEIRDPHPFADVGFPIVTSHLLEQWCGLRIITDVVKGSYGPGTHHVGLPGHDENLQGLIGG
jgi:hypothetical protein